MIKSLMKIHMAGNNCTYNVLPQEIEEQLPQRIFENLTDASLLHSPDSSGYDSFSHLNYSSNNVSIEGDSGSSFGSGSSFHSSYPVNNVPILEGDFGASFGSGSSFHSSYPINNVSILEGDSGASFGSGISSVISEYRESTFASRPVNAQLSEYANSINQSSSSYKGSSEYPIIPLELNNNSEYFNYDSSEETVKIIKVDGKSDLNAKTKVFNIVDSDEDLKFMPVIDEKPVIKIPNGGGYVVNTENFNNLNKISSSIEDGNSKNIDVVDLTEDDPMEINTNNTCKDTRMNILLNVLPDADLDFLKMKVDEINTDNDFHLFVAAALDLQNYPKKCIDRNAEVRNVHENTSGYHTTRKSVIDPLNFSTGSSSTSVAEPSLAPHTVTSTVDTSPQSAIYGVPHGTIRVDTPATPAPTLDPIIYPTHSVYNLTQNFIGPTGYNKPHTATSCVTSGFTTSQVSLEASSVPFSSVDFSSRAIQNHGSNHQRHAGVSSSQTGGANNINVNLPSIGMINHPLQSTLNNYLMTRFPTTNSLYQDPYVWFPEAMPLPTGAVNGRRTRRLITMERRQNLIERRLRYPISTEAAFLLGIEAIHDLSQQEAYSANSPIIQDPRYKLLSDILLGADQIFLQREAEKLKDDDDLAKFLVKAILKDELWIKHKVTDLHNLNIPSPKTQNCSEKKYKILLELFPDASPSFLKVESAKLKTDEEIHKFAIKLSCDKVYPKRKNICTKRNNKRKEPSDPEPIDPKYKTLLEMLPDADPDFLLQHSKLLVNDDELQAFVLKAVEENSYPKRDQYLERQEYQKQWKKYIEHFNVKEYLQVIPNPVKYFYIDKKTSKDPFDISMKFLQHRYRHRIRTFGSLYMWKKDSLTKTCDNLDQLFVFKPHKYGVWDQKTIFSTAILQEIAFIQNKKEIAHFMLLRDEVKLIAFEKAKSEGTLQECKCCCEDKLPEDMSSCTGGHIYCLHCIKRGSEVVIGNGGTTFPCYSEDCKEEFSLTVLKNVLNAEVFSRMISRKQYAEVNAAGIPGLETCNFCEFCSIPPPEDKLFHCLNPSCMKITCRNCKRIDHLPLSCEEFEKKATQQKMQSYVEDKMTEALVRTCWQCGTKFVKVDGCNMIKCKCGARMCYFCRKPILNMGYCKNERCIRQIDTTAHDEEVVLNVGKKAKMDMEVANPGFKLSNDPTKLLKRNRQREHMRLNTYHEHQYRHYYNHPNVPYNGP